MFMTLAWVNGKAETASYESLANAVEFGKLKLSEGATFVGLYKQIGVVRPPEPKVELFA